MNYAAFLGLFTRSKELDVEFVCGLYQRQSWRIKLYMNAMALKVAPKPGLKFPKNTCAATVQILYTVTTVQL